MITFWHLTAVCCIPASNPLARQREREILRLAAQALATHAVTDSKKPGRWEADTSASIKKSRLAKKNSPEVTD